MKRLLLTLAAAALLAAPHTAHAATTCAVTSAAVDAGTATFVVGPGDCTGTVGPISFSSYLLRSGKILPYSEQVLIEHHASNGAAYGPGSYTLTVSLDGALCWQTDLYYGTSIDVPPHPHTIAVDYQQGTPPCQTSSTTTSTSSTLASSTTGSTTSLAPTATVAETAPSVALVPPPLPTPAEPTPAEPIALAPPPLTPALTPLPETGNGSLMLAVLAAAVLALGIVVLRSSRRKGA